MKTSVVHREEIKQLTLLSCYSSFHSLVTSTFTKLLFRVQTTTALAEVKTQPPN